jgi:hypothetical protein
MRRVFPNIENLVRLLLVVPPTSATAERSFSGLRRLLTWLRSTTSESRLTHLAILNIHREIANELDLVDVCKEFLFKDNRSAIFGKF